MTRPWPAIWTNELLYIIVGLHLRSFAERKFRAGYQMSDLSGILTISITTFAAKIIML